MKENKIIINKIKKKLIKFNMKNILFKFIRITKPFRVIKFKNKVGLSK